MTVFSVACRICVVSILTIILGYTRYYNSNRVEHKSGSSLTLQNEITTHSHSNHPTSSSHTHDFFDHHNKNSSNVSPSLENKQASGEANKSFHHKKVTTVPNQAQKALEKLRGKRFRPIPRWMNLKNGTISSATCITENLGDQNPSSFLYFPKDFQHRAPYFMMIGAMNAGMSLLSEALSNHSLVVRSPRPIHFFDDDSQFVSSSATHGQPSPGDVIYQSKARVDYRDLYSRQMEDMWTFFLKDNMVGFDEGPRDYLFLSHCGQISARVLCVTPWVKLIAILRNPIDRAHEQYLGQIRSSQREELGDVTSFEDWIQSDLDNLRLTGVIRDGNGSAPLSGAENEYDQEKAWKKYMRLGTDAPVGRGLYALQLRFWFKAMKEVGKSRRNDFMVINAEHLHAEKHIVYRNVLRFLQLADEPLRGSSNKRLFVSSQRNTSIHPDTRRMLMDVFRPFNQQLYAMLRTNWTGIWEKQPRRGWVNGTVD